MIINFVSFLIVVRIWENYNYVILHIAYNMIIVYYILYL